MHFHFYLSLNREALKADPEYADASAASKRKIRNRKNVKRMVVLTTYAKQRILFYYFNEGSSSTRIRKLLAGEGIFVSRVTVWKFIRQFCATGCISRKQGSGRPTKITTEIKELVETQMSKDDETTAYQLHKLLTDSGYSLSISTVLRCRLELGWTFRGSYCDLNG